MMTPTTTATMGMMAMMMFETTTTVILALATLAIISDLLLLRSMLQAIVSGRMKVFFRTLIRGMIP